MRSGRTATLAVLAAARLAAPAPAPAAPAGPGPTTIVVCAPGYPGSTAEAASAMDAFAAALAAAARQPRGAFAAEYHETEAGGMARLARPDADVLLAPLPFFLEHEAALRLAARAQAVTAENESTEQYALVARKGKLAGPSALDGWEILGTVGYAPRFVRGPVLGAWGELPATTRISFSGSVLSALRRAAAGQKVAVLLDRAQASGLASLPGASDLEVVTRSAALPAALVATVGDRVSAPRAGAITKALLGLASHPDGAAALANLRLARFAPLDVAGLAKARRAWAAVPAKP
jgi:hypothetical protein